MGLKIGNVIQAKAVAVGFGDNGTTLKAFNLPPQAQIVGVRCGGPTVFGAATTLTVAVHPANDATSPVTIANIDAISTIVTMTVGSDASFVRLGEAYTVTVAVSAGGAVAGDLAVVVDFM